MLIKCSKEEKEFLVSHFGIDAVEKYPWRDREEKFDTDICELLYDLIIYEGFDEEGYYNDLGKKYQAIYDSLLYQNRQKS